MPILLGLLALFVLALPWALLLRELPIAVPLLLDVLLLLLGAGALAVRSLVRRRSGKSLQRALARPTPGSADPAMLDRHAEVDGVERTLANAASATRRARGARNRPWYVLLGPPESGKSSLLRACGLPLAPPDGAPVRGARDGGCSAWLAPEAVLVDTVGAWATSPDGVVWSALSRALAQEARLDGVLVTLSVSDLRDRNEAERAATARHLRARLDVLLSGFARAVPVYVLVTKCDELPGFEETFSTLPRAERNAAWGFTLPMRAPEGREIEDGLLGLASAARARVLARVADERRPGARALAVELPAHFARLREPLVEMTHELLATGPQAEPTILRGIYFTSARLGGTARRPLASALAARATPGSTPPPGEARSHFVRDLFTKLVFPDARRVVATRRAAHRRTITEATIGLALAVLSATFAIGGAFSWRQNRLLVDETWRVTTQPLHATAGAPVSPDALAPLRAQVERLRGCVDLGPPISMRLGLWSGELLARRATLRYGVLFRDTVLAPVLAAEAEELAAWSGAFESQPDGEPAPDVRARARTLLERQLRLGGSRSSAEPKLDADARERIARGLAGAWCGRIGAPTKACERDASLFVELLENDPQLRARREPRAVERARGILARGPSARLMVLDLVADTEGRGYDLTLGRLIGTTGHSLVASAHVRGAFTHRAWDERVRARIDALLDERSAEAWLVGRGPSTPAEEARRRDELRAAYFAAYVEEWEVFLSSVRVAPAHDPAEALALLEELTRGSPPPLGRLLLGVAENARLSDAALTDEDVAASPTGLVEVLRASVLGEPAREVGTALDDGALSAPSAVERALAVVTDFAVPEPGAPEGTPLGLEVYREELALLRDALATYEEDSSTAAALEIRVAAARRRVDGLVADRALGGRAFFETVLRPPIESASATSEEARASGVAASFCASVTTPFVASATGRYPFAAGGSDMALADFASLYRPRTGVLWSFYEASLAGIAPRTGSRFELPRRAHGRASSYEVALPRFLERSDAISRAFFPPGETEPRVEVDVRIHPTAGAAAVRLSVGGATVDYHNGPETWSRVAWPGPSPSAGASLEVLNARGMQERLREGGEWGLFRLVEAASGNEATAGDRARTLTWDLPGHDLPVVIDVRPVRDESPLFGGARGLGPLRASSVGVPRRVARGASPCTP